MWEGDFVGMLWVGVNFGCDFLKVGLCFKGVDEVGMIWCKFVLCINVWVGWVLMELV